MLFRSLRQMYHVILTIGRHPVSVTCQIRGRRPTFMHVSVFSVVKFLGGIVYWRRYKFVFNVCDLLYTCMTTPLINSYEVEKCIQLNIYVFRTEILRPNKRLIKSRVFLDRTCPSLPSSGIQREHEEAHNSLHNESPKSA